MNDGCDKEKAKDAITSEGQENQAERAFRTSQAYKSGAGTVSPGLSGMDAIGQGIKIADDVTPPGGEHVVKALKEEPGVQNPWAVAWAMKNRGEI